MTEAHLTHLAEPRSETDRLATASIPQERTAERVAQIQLCSWQPLGKSSTPRWGQVVGQLRSVVSGTCTMSRPIYTYIMAQ